MKDLLQYLNELFTHVNTYIISIGVGLLAKISYDLYMKRTLSLIQWVAVIAISVFCGYLTGTYCHTYNMHDASQILVPLATLFGEKLIQYVMENHKTILNNLISMFKRK